MGLFELEFTLDICPGVWFAESYVNSSFFLRNLDIVPHTGYIIYNNVGGLPFLFTLSSHISFDFFLHVFQETDSSSHLQLPHLAVLLYLRGQESKVTQLHLFTAIFHSWVSQSFFHSWVSQSSRCCFSRICGLFSDSYITNVKFTSFYCFQAFLYA